jgi:hypothetical protein
MNRDDLKLRPELVALGYALAGLILVSMVLIGLGGTVYKLLAPDGWVAQAFERSFAAGLVTLVSIVSVALLAWLSRGSASPIVRNRAADVIVYALAVVGVFYAVQLALKGTL